MSWECYNYDETATCACNNGTVIKHCYYESDDWGRSRRGHTGIDILCPDCQSKYHIGKITRRFFCYPGEGDGFVTKEYLVPIGLDLPEVMIPTLIETGTLDADIVSQYSKDMLQNVIDDMTKNKYTTRVQLPESRAIIDACNRRLHTKSTNKISPFLQDVLLKYDTYQWNPDTVAEFKAKEAIEIQANEDKISDVISKSFELKFAKR